MRVNNALPKRGEPAISMIGLPGAGETLIARTLPRTLAEMAFKNTISHVCLVSDGNISRTGELSIHCCDQFIDEIPNYKSKLEHFY
jgi:hypothetical protein